MHHFNYSKFNIEFFCFPFLSCATKRSVMALFMIIGGIPKCFIIMIVTYINGAKVRSFHCSSRVGVDIIAARSTISTFYVLFKLLANYSLRFLWGLTKSWTRLKYHEYIIFFQVKMEHKSLPISYEYLCFVIIVFCPYIWVCPACVLQVNGIDFPSCKLK